MNILVVKCGGNGAVDSDAVCRDVAEITRDGTPVVLVHGGSSQIEQLAGRLGVAQRVQVSPDGVESRHTDEAMMEVVMLALAGAVKPHLVGTLLRHGVNAIGLTGLDGALLLAKRKAPQRSVVDGRRVLVRDNRAGTVTRVNSELLRMLVHQGMVPVVSPPAWTDDGEAVNINADRVAAAIAAALGARMLVLLTGAPGVLSDPADERSVLSTVVAAPGPNTVGGMALKLVAAREALLGGVSEVRIADGRREHPVRAALDGSGTRVVTA